MATESVKKAIVEKADLPPVGPNNSYLVRYRIVSQNINAVSDWSIPVEVFSTDISLVDGDIDVSSAKTAISVTWGDENNRPDYDIYVRFGDNSAIEGVDSEHWMSWFYHGTSPIHTYKFLIPSTGATVPVGGAKRVEVQIQVASSVKELPETIINNVLKVYRGYSTI